MKKIILGLSIVLALMIAPTALGAKKTTKPVKIAKQTNQTEQEATDSIKNILAEAKKGDAKAQNDVGLWYYEGRHVDRNYKTALQWWSKSAKQGYAIAIGNMALCYQTGNGIERDSLKAAQLYMKSIEKGNKSLFKKQRDYAEDGDVFSNMLVATCYEKGVGTEKDPNAAVKYFAAAAQKGSTEAQLKAGVMYLNSKKPAEAIKYFKMGYEKKQPVCTYYYGMMLNTGKGTKREAKEGADIMLKAAEMGQRQAMYDVANCYFDGNGLTRNAEQGMKWMHRAAASRATNAAWVLAGNYRQGIGTPVSYDRALYWYAMAMDRQAKRIDKLLNDTLTKTEPAFISYLRGVKAYNDKNFDAALKEFKAVEKAKVIDGKVMTGAIYCNPAYAKNNVKKGVKLLTEASATSLKAQYLLATFYEAGKGVDKDMSKAVEMMTKAADAGYGPAECALGDMYFEGRGVEKNLDKAVDYYNRAFEQGEISENAAKRLAECYREGHGGLEVSAEKAEEVTNSYVKPSTAALLALLK